MDPSTEPNTPPVEPVVVPTAVVETPEQLAELADAEVEAVIAEATDAAQAATEAETFDEPVFEAAFARAQAARAEMTARTERAARLSAARDRAAQLAATRPAAPALPAVPSVADISKTTPAVPSGASMSFALIVPGDAHNIVPGKSQGTEYGSFSEIGQVLDKWTGSKVTSSKKLLEIQRTDHRFSIHGDDPMRDDAIIRSARDQKRLTGGSLMRHWEKSILDAAGGDTRRVSLTAAAGWCAPSETYYDLCEMESLDGLIDLPTVTATRGGIRWTQEPTYPQLDAATAYTHLTEAQVISGTLKTCAPITCPTFVDTRLDVSSTCLTGSFLQLRGYPELVARWVRGELVVHAHKRNEDIIAQLVARAGAVTPIILPAGDPIISALLSAVELAAEDIRYRNRLAFDAPIEIILPHWVIPLIRADFTRRNGGDPGLTNAMILDWFAVRGVRPQFVYDWQDGYSGAGATFPGGDGTAPFSATLVPAGTAVQFLAFPAGGVVLAQQDVITLRNVYDAANLTQNLYTELFFEEGWAPIYPCPEIRLYSALTCPSGATAVQIDLDCTP